VTLAKPPSPNEGECNWRLGEGKSRRGGSDARPWGGGEVSGRDRELRERGERIAKGSGLASGSRRRLMMSPSRRIELAGGRRRAGCWNEIRGRVREIAAELFRLGVRPRSRRGAFHRVAYVWIACRCRDARLLRKPWMAQEAVSHLARRTGYRPAIGRGDDGAPVGAPSMSNVSCAVHPGSRRCSRSPAG
jgi:hypothetical protein